MEMGWNPWHGCTKLSAGCKYCYVYRQDSMYGAEQHSSEIRKTANFNLPIKRKRDKSYKLQTPVVYTCFTSDFFVEEADEWRVEAWEMIKERSDLTFVIFTKRIDRFSVNLPEDWGEGYENVVIGCTTENQEMADYRLPIFNSLPIRHKLIIAAPLLGNINFEPYLNDTIEEVSVGGESGLQARVCDFEWIKSIHQQCTKHNIPFCFHQTGANFRKDGKYYNIPRNQQHSQAQKANLNSPKLIR